METPRLSTIETLPYEILTSILSYWPAFLLPRFRLISPSFSAAVDSLLYTRFKEHYQTLDGCNFIFESAGKNLAQIESPNESYDDCVYKGSKRIRPGSSFSEGEWREPEREEMAALGEWWSSFVPKKRARKCVWETAVFSPLGTLVSRDEKRGVLTTVNSVFEGNQLIFSKEWLESQAERGESSEGEWVHVDRKEGTVGVMLRIKVSRDENVVDGKTLYKLLFEEVMVKTGRLMIILERARAEEIEILAPLQAGMFARREFDASGVTSWVIEGQVLTRTSTLHCLLQLNTEGL